MDNRMFDSASGTSGDVVIRWLANPLTLTHTESTYYSAVTAEIIEAALKIIGALAVGGCLQEAHTLLSRQLQGKHVYSEDVDNFRAYHAKNNSKQLELLLLALTSNHQPLVNYLLSRCYNEIQASLLSAAIQQITEQYMKHHIGGIHV